MNWVSIKDKLPKLYQRVLSCGKNKDGITWIEVAQLFKDYQDNSYYWFIDDRDCLLDEVIYWMSFPEYPE